LYFSRSLSVHIPISFRQTQQSARKISQTGSQPDFVSGIDLQDDTLCPTFPTSATRRQESDGLKMPVFHVRRCFQVDC
jgi:hypothetical protein